MKPFFWDKVSVPNTAANVWNAPTSQAQLVDLSDLEAMFRIDNNPSTTSQTPASPSKKRNVTTLLDITRANNIGIMLSRIKLTFPDITKCILEINDEKLSVEDLRAISKQLPTIEEVVRIQDFDDISKLAKADQYFGEIITIPRLNERLNSMIYRRKLDIEITEVRPELDSLWNASRELRSCTKFKRILQIVLAVGNALNGSTFRGGAKAFQLDGLLKMKETKTANAGPGCPTLMHYVARLLLHSDPTLVTFIDDLPNLENAARIAVQTTLQTVSTLVGGVAAVKTEVATLKRAPTRPPGDKFIPVMEAFVLQVASPVEALENMGRSLEAELKSMLQFYGEKTDPPDARKPEDFFGLILSFSIALQKCALEVGEAEEKLQKTLAPAPAPPPTVQVDTIAEEDESTTPEPTIKGLLKDPSGDTLSPMNSQGYATGRRSIGRGDLDQAMRSLREGKKRVRTQRPLSKIFIDGSGGGNRQSRIFD